MKFKTSNGLTIDMRKLRSDDRLFIYECEDETERAKFIDECVDLYRSAWKKNILAK